MKKANNKREKILDAMQEMMAGDTTNSLSVSDIARRAGIGKGSIYYYFQSKEDILEAVIERSYSDAIEECKRLAGSSEMDVFERMGIIFRACRESSLELRRQETQDFLEAQHSALLHQKFVGMLVRNIAPLLADIIRQGNDEGKLRCAHPAEMAELVVLVLAVKLDNQLLHATRQEIAKFLSAFTDLLQTGFEIQPGKLDYLRL